MEDQEEPTNSESKGPQEIVAGATFDSHSSSYEEVESSDATRDWEVALRLSAYSILGVSLRVYMGRFFGGDCDGDYPDDFLSNVSTEICITSNGTSNREGGALFFDLPANMLGSFLVGTIASGIGDDDRKRSSHHTAFKVGFCGALTSFSGWAVQMTQMMYGAESPHGTQIPQAVFGYIIGLASAVWAYNLGIDTAASLFKDRFESLQIPTFVLIVLAVLVTVMFGLGVSLSGISFYREMCLSCLIAPLVKWLPWATLHANLMGTAIAAALAAVLARFSDELSDDEWTRSVLVALKISFAGALSTVSNLVFESSRLEPIQSFCYWIISILLGTAISILLYAPIVQ